MDRQKTRTTEDEFFFWMGKASVDFISQAMGSSGVLVYLWLCYYANINDQVCYPSITTITKKARLGRRKVSRLLKQLEAFGFVEVTRTPGKPNLYRLLQCEMRSVDNLLKMAATRV